ncbi:MAG: hypothetical protein IJZ85_07885 [Lachnospiraceae bacterium]|nr:hypothetical protein [Lachnospiraceae bacterium]
MRDWKAMGKKLLFPPAWVTILLTIFCAVALTVVFLKGLDTSPVAYAVYVLSFYSLIIFCIACVEVFPGCYRKIRQTVYDSKLGNRYMTDIKFKTHVSLYRSLAINLLFAAVKFFMGMWYKTAWFIIFAVYYAILALMRFLLLRYVGRNELGQKRIDELKWSRVCAWILLSLNFVLTGAVMMIMYQNRGYDYPGMLIYVVAMYTFYATGSAIADVIRYRKYNSPVMSTAKIINLASALVSMLALETAMLSQFGADNPAEFHRIMIASTGAGVSAVVIGMALYMIIRANQEIKKDKIGNTGR